MILNMMIMMIYLVIITSSKEQDAKQEEEEEEEEQQQQQQQEEQQQQQTIRLNLNNLNNASIDWKSTKILFYGDDTLYSGISMPGGFLNMFRHRLEQQMNSSTSPIDDHVLVEHRRTIREGFSELSRTLDELQPTILIVQFGVNDVLIDSTPGDGWEYFKYYLELIVLTANDANIATVICSPTLLSDDPYEDGPAHSSLETITGIGRSAANLYNASFIDVFSSFHQFIDTYNKFNVRSFILTIDCKTLNDSGHQLFASLLLHFFGLDKELINHRSIANSNELLMNTVFLDRNLIHLNDEGSRRSEHLEQIVEDHQVAGISIQTQIAP
jgi:hypothetical protein